MGEMSTRIHLMLLEKTVIPAIAFDLETWTYWWRKDSDELEIR